MPGCSTSTPLCNEAVARAYFGTLLVIVIIGGSFCARDLRLWYRLYGRINVVLQSAVYITLGNAVLLLLSFVTAIYGLSNGGIPGNRGRRCTTIVPHALDFMTIFTSMRRWPCDASQDGVVLLLCHTLRPVDIVCECHPRGDMGGGGEPPLDLGCARVDDLWVAPGHPAGKYGRY
jgi:hypothetical protein